MSLAKNSYSVKDLLVFASMMRSTEPRTVLFREALSVLSQSSTNKAFFDPQLPIPLSLELALEFDTWIINPQLGDSPISPDVYISNLSSILSSYISGDTEPSHPFIRLIPNHLQNATNHMEQVHGISSVVPFLLGAWSNSTVLTIDEIFIPLHTAIRAEAFSCTMEQALKELEIAERESNGVSFLDRAKKLAEIDKECGRDPIKLVTLAERKQNRAEKMLSQYRQLTFDGFIRGIHALFPVYYTLRDIWFELHFLADKPADRDEFNYKECFVDERQADIGQLIKVPHGSIFSGEIRNWCNLSESKRQRRLKFWYNSRIQINRAIFEYAQSKLSSIELESDAEKLEQEIDNMIMESISDGHRQAISLAGYRIV